MTTIDLTDALTLDEHAALTAALQRESRLLREAPLRALADRWPVFARESQRFAEAEYLESAMRKLRITQ